MKSIKLAILKLVCLPVALVLVTWKTLTSMIGIPANGPRTAQAFSSIIVVLFSTHQDNWDCVIGISDKNMNYASENGGDVIYVKKTH